MLKTLETDDGRVELRAVTGPDYGRIWDHELVAAVMKIAGNGTGDTRWKVPGVMDWSTMTHNPLVDVTKDTTTLYASDRDVFLFLVDDTNPIEAGKLPDDRFTQIIDEAQLKPLRQTLQQGIGMEQWLRQQKLIE